MRHITSRVWADKTKQDNANSTVVRSQYLEHLILFLRVDIHLLNTVILVRYVVIRSRESSSSCIYNINVSTAISSREKEWSQIRVLA